MNLMQYLENLIGEKISDGNLYFEAFQHHQDKNFADERLEYLGDAVLELVTSDFLFQKFPNEREGFLTVMRSKITNRKFLNDVALKLEFDKFVKLDNERSVVKYLYGCVLESFIGALYLDFGFAKSKDIVLRIIIFPYVNFENFDHHLENPKGALLEYFQKNRKKVEFLTYQIDDPNVVSFESRIVIDGILQRLVEVASSKKEAEQILAKKILETPYL
ncbi:MAG: hypothetical protein LBD32_02305 [Cytophagales bacterium]|jgi:ribonuclease-3|nr:hypothetical protein [Cytophagales bacterium]